LTGRRTALVLAPLVAILIYLPTTRYGFVLDDEAVVVENPLMQDLGDLPRLLVAPYWNRPMQGGQLYRPLTSLTLALDRAIAGGPRPGWFHFVNTLLHGLATLLVTLLALEVLPGAGAALVAGLLFAVHPVHVEAVAGIVGRAEILAASCVLASLLLHRKAQRLPGRGGWLAMLAAWGTAFLGMMAKESAAVAGLLCAVSDMAFTPGAGSGRRRVLYAGHAAVFAAFLGARLLVVGAIGTGGPIPFVDNPAASAGPVAGRLTAVGTVARYAALLLWPRRLSADYSFDQIPIIHSILDPLALAGSLIVLLLVAGGVLLLRRAPAGGFALLWIAISAMLTSNLLVFIGTAMAERLMYLPSIGLCLLAGWGVARAAEGGHARIALAGALCACMALGARAWTRLPDWRDDFALYSSAAMVSPRSARIRYNLGNAHLRREEYGRAEDSYRMALSILPGFNDARVNLGMALLQQGRASEALGHFQTAAQERPGRADIALNLGNAYRVLRHDDEAEAEFRRAIALDPGSAKAWNNLGSIAMARSAYAGAVEHLRKAVDLEPEVAIFRVNLADALVAAGRAEEATPHFETAARLAPDLPETLRGLGELALRRGDRAEAEREFRRAATGRPASARAANFLGYLLSLKGDARGAVESYELALALDPSLYDAHRSLGMLYARTLGDPERGALHLEASLRMSPDQPDAASLRRVLRELRR
jgi:tetratricopeptide (TPR) repeat protein